MNTVPTSKALVVITYDPEYEEYCVRKEGAPKGHGYFTPWKDDAENTARHENGQDCIIKHRRKRET